jgi:GNAT superfamily N-acetyltransferase
MTPWRVTGRQDWPALLHLIQGSFEGMEGRIDPPSSAASLTVEDIARMAQGGEIWAIGRPPLACVVLTPKPGALHLGKLAVAASHRGRGLARALIAEAETRARALGLPMLELQTRVELVENHVAFRAMGFTQTGSSAHPGFDRPTSLRFTKPVPPDAPAPPP